MISKESGLGIDKIMVWLKCTHYFQGSFRKVGNGHVALGAGSGGDKVGYDGEWERVSLNRVGK